MPVTPSSGSAGHAGNCVSALRAHPQDEPRDIATDLGKPHDSMLRMILRRGIPFGMPSSRQETIEEAPEA